MCVFLNSYVYGYGYRHNIWICPLKHISTAFMFSIFLGRSPVFSSTESVAQTPVLISDPNSCWKPHLEHVRHG